jgi:hypothetical protein
MSFMSPQTSERNRRVVRVLLGVVAVLIVASIMVGIRW